MATKAATIHDQFRRYALFDRVGGRFMGAKSLALLTATALLAIASATTADAQDWHYGNGRGYGYGPGYGPGPSYGYRPRCLSSDGINESLARRGLYPLANVGGDGPVLHMRVQRGYEQFIVAIDGCTGRILQ
jgi:hypothetical protein